MEKVSDQPVKFRNLLIQFFLAVVTFGIYIPYWFYSTACELETLSKREQPVILWTILLFVPFGALYSHYKYAELLEEIAPETERWTTFWLWIFFAPAVWASVQTHLNQIAITQPQPAASSV